MREIQLTRGKVAIVDDEDYETLNAHRWCAYRSYYTFYATRRVRRPDGARAQEDMHRVILSRKLGRQLVQGEQSEHKNGNGLDNQRDNLRPATQSQNNRNCRRHVANPSSRFLGVIWDKDHKKWRAQLQGNYKQTRLGRYDTELEAALAREYYIVAHPELMARSNFTQSELAI